jgi:hypothetical protein
MLLMLCCNKIPDVKIIEEVSVIIVALTRAIEKA